VAHALPLPQADALLADRRLPPHGHWSYPRSSLRAMHGAADLADLGRPPTFRPVGPDVAIQPSHARPNPTRATAKSRHDAQLTSIRPSRLRVVSSGCSNTETYPNSRSNTIRLPPSPTHLLSISHPSRTHLVPISHPSPTRLLPVSYPSPTRLLPVSYPSPAAACALRRRPRAQHMAADLVRRLFRGEQ
jgi:hypothetical protein